MDARYHPKKINQSPRCSTVGFLYGVLAGITNSPKSNANTQHLYDAGTGAPSPTVLIVMCAINNDLYRKTDTERAREVSTPTALRTRCLRRYRRLDFTKGFCGVLGQ